VETTREMLTILETKIKYQKNPNKTKPLYIDEYTDKKNRKKESQIMQANEEEIYRTILEY
jgi:hypothetical protein